ncbi:transposon TX1 [Tanacetum coccineum]
MIKNTSGIKDVDFEEANKNNVFNEGGGNEARSYNKKSKLLKKEKNVVRIQGAGDLGAIETWMADVYKAFHDEGDGKKETFVFRSTGRADSGNKGCSINMDQVKEIGELIGISWAKAENIKERDGEILGREDDKVDHQEERPDIIGLQETKCGMLDDPLIEERFVSVKGEWKGRDGDVAWCIFSSLNVVRSSDERMNSQVNSKETMEFNDFINDANLAWKMEIKSKRPDCRFRDKLKNVKVALKKWSKERFGKVNEKIEVFRKEAMTWELEAENGALSEIEREPWIKARKSWDPKLIKAEMARHYKALFSEGTCCDHVGKISVDDALVVEKEFTEGDIWDAEDMIGVIKWFGESMKISKGCNSSFVTIIPKVTDPIGLVDFHPIGLIGFYYKIIVKVLAERIKRVVGKVVEMHTAYRGFLGVGTTFNSFQNLHIRYLEYGVLMSSGYDVLIFVPSWFLVKCRHRYAISSLMDTAYRMSEVGEELDGLGLEFVSSFVGEVGNGNDIRFWIDKWVGGDRLCDRFPRLYHLDKSKEFDCRDRWRWALQENGDFTVRELSKLVEEKTLGVEFFASSGNVNIPCHSSKMWQAVIWTSGYFIWKERNARVFKGKSSSLNKIVQDIQLKSFEWIVRRSGKKSEMSWLHWLLDPDGCTVEYEFGLQIFLAALPATNGYSLLGCNLLVSLLFFSTS